jgi:hypothetical protein
MVSATINGHECEIKTSWDEVNVLELAQCNDFKDECKLLTTIPHDIIEQATETQLFPIYTLFSFIDEAELFREVEAVPVDRDSYEHLELAKMALREGKPYKKIIKSALVYYPEEKETVRLIGLGISIVNQIALFLSNYEDMIKDPPDSTSEAAGIEELSAFGAWGTAFNLAGKDLMKVGDIMKRPAIEVYTALYYSWKESKYIKRYYELKNPKK